jgi:hypothetical protein
MKARAISDRLFAAANEPRRPFQAQIGMSRFWLLSLTVFLLAAPALAVDPNELAFAERQR